MQYALTADEMRAVEERAIASGVTTLDGLMQRAGRALAEEVDRLAPAGAVVCACGPGNNGGDGWVAARLLAEAGRVVRVITLVEPSRLEGAARAAAEAAIAAGVPFEMPASAFDVLAHLDGAAAVVDAIFGFGARGAPREPYASAIEAINDADALVLSADVPSGVDADTGAVAGAAVRAHVTVTFTAPKPGLLIYPGAAHAGEVIVRDLGIPHAFVDEASSLELWDLGDYRAAFPHPRPDDHKGSRGRVAVVAGSATYPGAAVLTATGALRMGAGYVVVVTPEPVAPLVHAALPNVIVRTVPASDAGSISTAADVLAACADADAIVAGSGLTVDGGAVAAVRAIVSHASAPLVLDADGLTAFAGDAGALRARTAPLLLTPHPREAARLLERGTKEVQADRLAAARSLASPAAACLLKGPHSVVADAERTAIVLAGNEGLARAGSGDVLAGMAGTLMAQGLGPYEAAALGAFLHGRAAEHGTAELTTTCFVATDIVSFLPRAVADVLGAGRGG